MPRATLDACRKMLVAHLRGGTLHLRGHAWVRKAFMPAVERLGRSQDIFDQHGAAHALRVLAELHDLNGTPQAAIRAYQKSLTHEQTSEAWHAIGCLLDHMGRFAAARRAMQRALALGPDDQIIAGDLERVEWAMLNPCPALYDDESELLRANEALAAGQGQRALKLLSRLRKIRPRQIRARAHAVMGAAEKAVAEWLAIAAQAGPVELQHADWYYCLRGPVADEPAFWRIMLWKIRPRLSGGVFQLPVALAEMDLSDTKRFELLCRYELARCERDIPALLSLTTRYPEWREPMNEALWLRHLQTKRRRRRKGKTPTRSQ